MHTTSIGDALPDRPSRRSLVFRLGWQVLWERIGDVVDPARVRRAIRISVVAAVLALIAAVVLQVRFAWAGTSVLGAVAAMAPVTLGFGLLLFSCFPTARHVDPAATINGRQVRPDAQLAVRWSVQPYLDRRARPVAPEDRAAVLNEPPPDSDGPQWRRDPTGSKLGLPGE
ncbi:hypothetical protein ACIPC2_17280 [Curtobacterium pusillum]|uniref:hypothetical protein n=1 Tax=Curtobacterium pusillum TaxID=69373 RepID=UPI0037F768A3